MRIMISALIGVAAAIVTVVPFFDTKQQKTIANAAITDEVEPKHEFEQVEYNPRWVCPQCSPDEQFVLEKLQSDTKITDKNALATIMGNIKQESKFIPNICEGGARVSYDDCLRGGYGLIQWTSTHRYLGLGKFARKYGCDPSTLECQTRYMINEPIFQKVLPDFEGGGQTVAQYMVPAYYWLGWGIRGPRDAYAYNYTKQMVLS